MTYFEGMKRLTGLPRGRAAYSDRMAYIGAELSRLVYEPFTPDSDLTAILKRLGEADSDSERKAILASWSRHLHSHNCMLAEGIRETLRDNNFEPINFYDTGDTQALMAKMDGGGHPILLLVFRGTEMKAGDIVTDLKFPLVPAGNEGRVHSGFKAAFENVRSLLEQDLIDHPGVPLFTFGHSLGGALALISTRELNPDGDGATYVYGCPRTGDRAYFRAVKTPVYRLEIGGDPVPMVPFGYGFSGFLALLRLIPLNGTQHIANWLRHKLLGYYHTGFRVFIKTAANEPDTYGFPFKKMRVDQSPNFFWRIQCIWRAWIGNLFNIKHIAGFHSIHLYSDMLEAYMLRRNRRSLKNQESIVPTYIPPEPATETDALAAAKLPSEPTAATDGQASTARVPAEEETSQA